MCWNPLCKVPFTCVIPLWNWINSPQRDILKSLNKRQPYKPALNVKDEWSLSPHALCEKHAWVPSPAQSAASMEAMEIISLTILPLSSQPVHHLPQCQLSQALSALACQSTAPALRWHNCAGLPAESFWERGSACKRTWQNLWLLLSQKQAPPSKLPCSWASKQLTSKADRDCRNEWLFKRCHSWMCNCSRRSDMAENKH